MGKIVFLIPLSFLISFSSFAQNNQGQTPESRIGITYSTFGEHSMVRFQETEDAGYSIQGTSNGRGDQFYVRYFKWQRKPVLRSRLKLSLPAYQRFGV